jgi:hypothetical protein
MSHTVELSLTDFVDFATKAGTPRLTKVKEVRRRGPYNPATDFWKPLREHICEALRSGTLTPSSLRDFALAYPDAKKVRRFYEASIGYARFIKRKEYEWFEPPYTIWTPHRMRVRINPEIGIRLDGHSYVLKLYLRDSPLSKYRTDLLTFLLRTQLATPHDHTVYGVLEVNTGKFYGAPESSVDLMPLLLGEAAAFIAIYDGLEPLAA